MNLPQCAALSLTYTLLLLYTHFGLEGPTIYCYMSYQAFKSNLGTDPYVGSLGYIEPSDLE